MTMTGQNLINDKKNSFKIKAVTITCLRDCFWNIPKTHPELFAPKTKTMNYRIAFIFPFLLLFQNSYSQNILDMRCVFYPQYVVDTTFEKKNEWSFLPTEKDSLFIYEEIVLSKWGNTFTYREYDKIMKERLNNLRNLGLFYVEELSKGASNLNYFQDYIFYDIDPINIRLNYERVIYNQELKGKNNIYSIRYTALIPRIWGPNEKWDLSISHFTERCKEIKLIYNECRK